jgi:hypothetical protein
MTALGPLDGSRYIAGSPVVEKKTGKLAVITGSVHGYPTVDVGSQIDGSYPFTVRFDGEAGVHSRMARDLDPIKLDVAAIGGSWASRDRLKINQLVFVDLPEGLIVHLQKEAPDGVDPRRDINARTAYVSDFPEIFGADDVVGLRLIGPIPEKMTDRMALSPKLVVPLAVAVGKAEPHPADTPDGEEGDLGPEAFRELAAEARERVTMLRSRLAGIAAMAAEAEFIGSLAELLTKPDVDSAFPPGVGPDVRAVMTKLIKRRDAKVKTRRALEHEVEAAELWADVYEQMVDEADPAHTDTIMADVEAISRRIAEAPDIEPRLKQSFTLLAEKYAGRRPEEGKRGKKTGKHDA